MRLGEWLLSKVAEEASEVSHACHKGLIHGLLDNEPGTNLTVAEQVVGEYWDLVYVSLFLKAYLAQTGSESINFFRFPDHALTPEQETARFYKQSKVTVMLFWSVHLGVVKLTDEDKVFLKNHILSKIWSTPDDKEKILSWAFTAHSWFENIIAMAERRGEAKLLADWGHIRAGVNSVLDNEFQLNIVSI